jgi:hypothetical protein
MENITEISIEHENAINETSDDTSCSSTIKVNPLSIQKSKRFKVDSSKTNIQTKHSKQTSKKYVQYKNIKLNSIENSQ